jgi:energy-coupling factor transporter ATP-binding protein EcfA2
MAIIGLPEAKATLAMLQLAHKQGWLDKALYAFRKKHKVLVLGSTGVGKTNLLQSLTTLTPEVIHYMNRTEFAQKHQIRIAKEPFQFHDTPGEIGKASRRTRVIREALAAPIAGVINVVSYGYHEQRNVDASIFDDNGLPTQAYLERQRNMEINALAEWTELLGDEMHIGWAMTVVTKADLWWHKKDEVLAHYATGPYSAALGSLKRFAPSVLEYSSVFHKFYDRSPMSGEFDDRDRQRARSNLLRTLLESVGRSTFNG